jgi:hypothetical protein
MIEDLQKLLGRGEFAEVKCHEKDWEIQEQREGGDPRDCQWPARRWHHRSADDAPV